MSNEPTFLCTCPRFGESFEAYGVEVTHLRAAAPGDRPTLKQVEAALSSATRPYKAVTLTHVDTSTGVLMDVKKMAELVRGGLR